MKALSIKQWSRESTIFVTTLLIGAFLFIAVTTYGASVVGSTLGGVGTTTPLWGDFVVEQASQGRLKGVLVVGDTGTTTPTMFISQKGVIAFGSSTPSPIFLNQGDVVIGRDGSTNDLYVSGGLGIANATTTDGDFIIRSANPIFSFTSNGRLVVGATSTALTAPGAVDKFVFDGGDMVISSGGTGTTTVAILTEAAADGANGCIEMSGDGITYTIMINGAGTDVLVSQGSCDD